MDYSKRATLLLTYGVPCPKERLRAEQSMVANKLEYGEVWSRVDSRQIGIKSNSELQDLEYKMSIPINKEPQVKKKL